MTQPVCKASEITEKGREFRVTGEEGPFYLMIFRRQEQLLAYHNICPHQQRALSWAADKFIIADDGLLVCAHHGAAFELDSGECLQGPCKGAYLQAVSIRITGDEVWLA